MNATNSTNIIDINILIAATVTDFICLVIFIIMPIIIVTTLIYNCFKKNKTQILILVISTFISVFFAISYITFIYNDIIGFFPSLDVRILIFFHIGSSIEYFAILLLCTLFLILAFLYLKTSKVI
jgi:membrane-associated HD superfamily phosphohydrolase